MRRSLPKRCRTLPGMSSGEAGDVIPDSIQNAESHENSNSDREIYLSNLVVSNSCGDGVHIFQINIQYLTAHFGRIIFSSEGSPAACGIDSRDVAGYYDQRRINSRIYGGI